MAQKSKLLPDLSEGLRDNLAEIVTRFIRLSLTPPYKFTDEICNNAFNIAYKITSGYESESVNRAETVELAIELVERAKQKIQKTSPTSPANMTKQLEEVNKIINSNMQ